jgi:hypothetical protein
MIELYKYVSFKEDDFMEYRRQLIAERKLYFNEAFRFNDPLDCNIANWEKAKGVLKPARFFCLARSDRDDNLMFAHYGDEHRGIRLKFIADDEQAISDCSVLALGRPVVYQHEIPTFESSRAHEFYFLKSNSWHYEQEYRVVATEGVNLPYLDTELREVALGARFDMSLLPILKSWFKEGGHKKVQFVRAVPSSDFLEYDYVAVNA